MVAIKPIAFSKSILQWGMSSGSKKTGSFKSDKQIQIPSLVAVVSFGYKEGKKIM